MEALEKKVEQLKNELATRNLAEEAIEKLKKDYEQLVITDVTDVLQYNRVHEALQVVKKTRIGIEKFCKENRDGLNVFVKAISAEEKRLLALVEPLEEKLFNERKKVDDEKARIEREEKEALDKKMNERIKALGKYGHVIDFAEAVGMDDNTFESLLAEAEEKFLAEENRKHAEEVEREVKAKELEAQRIAQEEKELKLKAQQEEMDRKEREQKEREEKFREDKFKVRLQQLKGASFDGEGIYFDGQKLATKEELINIEDDKFYSLLKSHEENVLRIAQEAEKKRVAEMEEAKKQEAIRLENEAKEGARNKREALIESRIAELSKYAPECFEPSPEGREIIGNMTEAEYVDQLTKSKTSFDQREEEKRVAALKHAESMKSDLEKLENLALHLEEMSSEFPTLESEEGNKILSETKEGLGKIAFLIRERSKTV